MVAYSETQKKRSVIDPFSLPSLLITDRRLLPDCAGVYFVLGSDENVLYIGQSISLQRRWIHHERRSEIEIRGGVRIAWFTIDDLLLLNQIERTQIAHYQPPLNKPKKKKVSLLSLVSRPIHPQRQYVLRASKCGNNSIRITIPKDLEERWAIHAGDTLILEAREKVLLFWKRPEA